MKRFFYLTIFIIAFGGCTSPDTTTETKVSSNAPANAATADKTEAANTEAANTAANTETAANANQPNLRGAMLNKNTKSEMIVGKGQSSIAPEPIIAAKPTPQNAPDNSEIISATDAKGQMIEIRTFKNNATLSKIERNVTDAENPKIKIYLKNGKVLNVPPGKISNPQSASANEILSAAGLAPKTAAKNEAQPNKPKTDDQ